MSLDNNKSIKQDISKYLNKFYNWFKQLKWYFKLPLGILILLTAMIYLTITGYFGEYFQKKLVQQPFEKTEIPDPPVDYSFLHRIDQLINEKIKEGIEVNSGTYSDTRPDSSKYDSPDEYQPCAPNQLLFSLTAKINGKEGKVGSTYTSLDEIELNIDILDPPIHVLFINFDSDTIKKIPNLGLYSIELRDTQNTLPKYRLDSTNGLEIIYAIAACEKFEYSDIYIHIERYYNSYKNNINTKGGLQPLFQIQLPDGYVQNNFYFWHESKKQPY